MQGCMCPSQGFQEAGSQSGSSVMIRDHSGSVGSRSPATKGTQMQSVPRRLTCWTLGPAYHGMGVGPRKIIGHGVSTCMKGLMLASQARFHRNGFICTKAGCSEGCCLAFSLAKMFSLHGSGSWATYGTQPEASAMLLRISNWQNQEPSSFASSVIA